MTAVSVRITERVRRFIRKKGPKTRLDIFFVVGSFAVVLVLVGIGLFFAVTNPGSVDVIYENRTGENVRIYIDGYYDSFLPADESVSSSVYDWGDQRLVEAVNEDGKPLFAESFSKDDLGQMQYRIVILAAAP